MNNVLRVWLLAASILFAFNVQAEIKTSNSTGGKAAAVQRAALAQVATGLASSDAIGSSQRMHTGISTWHNLFGGLLLGLGMGGLLSASAQHQVLANNISTLFFVLLGMFVVFKIWHWLRHGREMRYDWETYVPEIDARIESAGLQLPPPDSADTTLTECNGTVNSMHEPILGFDAAVFVNQAKTRFVCLQVAWDKNDFNSIRRFTTPGMYAALRQQALQPGRLARHTDVVQLFGTLLGVRVLDREYVASVSFEGLMKPLPDASAEPFSEIWHITRPLAGTKGWALAGIEKIS